MFDLNKLVAEAYENERNKDFSFDRLVEMVESMMILQESLGVIEEETLPKGAQTPVGKPVQTREMVLRRIPIPQFTELGWGTAATVEDGNVTIPTSQERETLALYLNQIAPEEKGNFQAKINALNQFIQDAGDDQKIQQMNIQTSMSFLVFYRTLSMIISNFNASSAGFLFESFLAVLLDAEKGRQVPASAGSTIADIIVEPKGSPVPISLKLYSEKTIKVGGSFRQLIDDLTGQFDQMDYLVASKNFTGDTNKAVDSLKFYYFVFTLANIVKMIDYVNLEKELLILPEIFKPKNNDQYNQAVTDGTLEQALTIPPASKIDVKPYVEAWMTEVDTFLGGLDTAKTFTGQPAGNNFFDLTTKQIDNATKTKLKNKFSDFMKDNYDLNDGDTYGQDKNEKYIFTAGGSNKKNDDRTFKYSSVLANELFTLMQDELFPEKDTLIKKDSDGNILKDKKGNEVQQHPAPGQYNAAKKTAKREIIASLIQNINARYNAEYPKKEDDADQTKSPRALKITELYGGMSAAESVVILNDLASSNPTKYKQALLSTIGYKLERQFELTKPKFLNLMKSSPNKSGVNFGPYKPGSDGSIASLNIGEEIVFKTVNNVLENINSSINVVFEQLSQLQDNINAYVAGGLVKSEVAKAAEDNAKEIGDETAAIRKAKEQEEIAAVQNDDNRAFSQ